MAEKVVVPVGEFLLDDGAQIVDAIRSGCVDAFVVEELDGHAVYTLANTDLPYSTLVQRMHQGAAMLNPGGQIIYCNASLATLLGNTQEAMVGLQFDKLVLAEDQPAFQNLLDPSKEVSAEGEFQLRRVDDTVIPVRIAIAPLSRDKSVTGVLVSDLSAEKSHAKLAARLQSVEDEERKKLARELHDSVGQLLTAISMNVSRLRNQSPDLPPASTALLEDCGVMVDQVSREIRTISYLLHPPLLDMAGLSSAIRWYVDGFSHRSNIKVDLQIDPELGRLPGDLEISLFRVVQECLTNVYRHSGSDSCSISLRRDRQLLYMEIRDRGQGARKATQGEVHTGVGLRGMQERMRRLGGTLQAHFGETGTVVKVFVPIGAQSDT